MDGLIGQKVEWGNGEATIVAVYYAPPFEKSYLSNELVGLVAVLRRETGDLSERLVRQLRIKNVIDI